MADRLESNLIIRTQVRKPNRAGFIQLNKDVDQLERKLDRLASRRFDIDIGLRIDEGALRQVQGALGAAGAIPQQIPGRPPGGSPPRQGTPAQQAPRQPVDEVTRTVAPADDPDNFRVIQTTTRNIRDNLEDINTLTTRINEEGERSQTITRNVVDLQERGIRNAQRANELAKGRRQEQSRIDDENRDQNAPETGRVLGGAQRAGFDIREISDTKFTLERIEEIEGRRVQTILEINRLTGESNTLQREQAGFLERTLNVEEDRLRRGQIQRTERRRNVATQRSNVAATQSNLEGQGFRRVGQTETSITLEREVEIGGRRVALIRRINRETNEVAEAERDILSESERIERSLDRRNRRRAAEQDATRGGSARRRAQRQQIQNQGFEFQREESDGNVEVFTRNITDAQGRQIRQTAKLNTVTGELTVTRARDARATREQQRATDAATAATNRQTAQNQLLADGFQEISPRVVTDQVSGATQVIQRFQRVTGNVISGFRVELTELNSVTQRTTTQTLEGAAATRFLGDNMANAAQKVALWTTATSLVFGTIRVFQQVLFEVRELEKGSILLARVGRGLGRSFTEAGEQAKLSSGNFQAVDFKTRLSEARALTQGIVDLTAAIGGNAVEAQQAAAIFLRAGDSRRQALEGVRAALLASRIAEIEVVDAAELLSSAIRQFNLDARQLLPTLDQLNALSNNYKVTTDDLLQSISRAGSVAAEANTRLSELAAVTAVVAQTTSRTGTQIGNAFKTIQSRLDRLDVRTELFESLGISTVDATGETKSLTRVLLELQTALDGLTPSQQKNITLTVAGIRQRNILIAAVNNAEKAIEAEFLALEQAGSAQEEFGETANSLDAAIARLQGTFSQLSNSVGGEAAFVFSSLVNALSGLLKLFNAFDGLPLKIAAFVVAIAAMRIALNKLSASIGVNITLSSIFNARTITQTVTSIAATLATLGWTGAMRALAGALVTATVSLAAFIGPLIIINLIIAGIVAALSAWATASDRAAEAQQRMIDDSQKEAQAHKQRAQAIENVSNVILDQLILLKNLREESAKTGKDTRDQQRAIVENIERLRSRATIEGRSAVDIRGVNTSQPDRDDVVRFAANQEKKITAERTKQLQAKERELAILEKQSNELASQIFIPDNAPRGAVFGGVDFEELAKLETQYNDLQEQINEVKDELAPLRDDATFFGADTRIKVAELKVEVADLTQALSNLQDTRGTRNFLSGLFETNQIDFFNQELENSRRITRQLTKDITELSQEYNQDLQALQEATKRLNDENEKQAEILQRIIELRVKASQEAAEEADDRARELSETAALSRLRQRQAKFDLDSFTLERQRLKLRQQLVKARVEERNASLGDINRRSQNLTENLEIFDPDSASAAEARERLNAAAAQAKSLEAKQQEDLNRLAELELELAKSLFEEEAKIAEERKKQADEAARALGILSDEDKLRVLGQAEFFADNPDRNISFEEQIFGDQASNRILQRFFGDRADAFNPTAPTSELERILAAGGFGKDRELGDRERAVGRARRKADPLAEEERVIKEREDAAKLSDLAKKEAELTAAREELVDELFAEIKRIGDKEKELLAERERLVSEQRARFARRRSGDVREGDEQAITQTQKELRNVDKEIAELRKREEQNRLRAELRSTTENLETVSDGIKSTLESAAAGARGTAASILEEELKNLSREVADVEAENNASRIDEGTRLNDLTFLRDLLASGESTVKPKEGETQEEATKAEIDSLNEQIAEIEREREERKKVFDARKEALREEVAQLELQKKNIEEAKSIAEQRAKALDEAEFEERKAQAARDRALDRFNNILDGISVDDTPEGRDAAKKGLDEAEANLATARANRQAIQRQTSQEAGVDALGLPVESPVPVRTQEDIAREIAQAQEEGNEEREKALREEAKVLRTTATDRDVISSALGNAQDAVIAGAEAVGNREVAREAEFRGEPGAFGTQVDNQGQVQPTIGVDVQNGQFDFTPLTDEFERVISGVVSDQIAQASQEFQRIVDEKLSNQALRPTIAPTGQ